MKDQRSTHKPSNWDEIYCHEWGYPRAVFHWPTHSCIGYQHVCQIEEAQIEVCHCQVLLLIITNIINTNIIHILLSFL